MKIRLDWEEIVGAILKGLGIVFLVVLGGIVLILLQGCASWNGRHYPAAEGFLEVDHLGRVFVQRSYCYTTRQGVQVFRTAPTECPAIDEVEWYLQAFWWKWANRLDFKKPAEFYRGYQVTFTAQPIRQGARMPRGVHTGAQTMLWLRGRVHDLPGWGADFLHEQCHWFAWRWATPGDPDASHRLRCYETRLILPDGRRP